MRVLLYDRVTDREPVASSNSIQRPIAGAISGACSCRASAPASSITFRPTGRSIPSTGQRFDRKARLIDPYARALAGKFLPADDGIIRPPKCVVVDDTFDWQGDRHLRRQLVRDGDLRDARPRLHAQPRRAASSIPGTYLGVIEKIPYLKSLGVTAVELMPVHEFPDRTSSGGTKPSRPNYWGYDPLAFFSPHRGYAAGSEPGGQVASSSRWSAPCTRPASK